MVRLYAVLLLGVGAIVLIVSWMHDQPQPVEVLQCSVRVLDDGLDPLEGVLVTVTNGLDVVTESTDPFGQSDWFELGYAKRLELTVRETEVTDGVALGLLRLLDLSFFAPEGDADELNTLSIDSSVPVATPVSLRANAESGALRFDVDASYPHWVLTASSDVDLHAASLQDGADVAAYLRYRGLPSSEDTFLRAVVLVVEEDTPMRGEGLLVGVDTMGWCEPQDAVLEVVHFAAEDALPPFTVVPVAAGVSKLYVRLEGVLPKGHLAFLLRSAEGGPGNVRTVIERVSGHNSRPLEPISVADADCLPEVPGDPPTWQCRPAAPKQRRNHCDAKFLRTDCKTLVAGSPVWRGSPGERLVRNRAVLRILKVKSELDASSMLSGMSALLTPGELAFGVHETSLRGEIWTAANGDHDLGQCTQFFAKDRICRSEYEVRVEALEREGDRGWLPVACGATKRTATLCLDASDSQAVCSNGP